jgi:hypothetical protein
MASFVFSGIIIERMWDIEDSVKQARGRVVTRLRERERLVVEAEC